MSEGECIYDYLADWMLMVDEIRAGGDLNAGRQQGEGDAVLQSLESLLNFLRNPTLFMELFICMMIYFDVFHDFSLF